MLIFFLAKLLPEVKKDLSKLPAKDSEFTTNFQDLQGRSLSFPSSFIPLKRCLAFHACCARYEAIYVHKWIGENDFVVDDDAWSPNILEKPDLKKYIELWINNV